MVTACIPIVQYSHPVLKFFCNTSLRLCFCLLIRERKRSTGTKLSKIFNLSVLRNKKYLFIMALIPPVTRLTSSVIRILGCNPGPMTLQGTNTYLLGTGKSRILIDTGDMDVPEYIKHLQGVLKQEQASLSTIILTHWHHDHVGGVKDVLKTCAVGDCRVYKFPRTDAVDVCPEIPADIKVHPLHDEQKLSVDGANVKIVHTPGHTTDHVVLTTDDGILFSGDCILGEGTAVFEELYEYMKSLHKILDMKPAVIYPGHGNIIEQPVDKIQYYIDHRNQREDQIMDFFSRNSNKPLQAMDVVHDVYKETPEQLWPAAAYNVGHHLEKLQREGKLKFIAQNDEKYYEFQKISTL
ncbi:PREDICTED: beta-lactamase-like protein 2 homolog [Rhagoletis zephyria]|uniref:beta-lactamase-like protein 2 homolog n=1 Tax=Rhagoletis zephyria TaxID=28612 RepID=UPI0008113BF8|nr:PREDICTED: beta-lactamase-like protein 2 homolog [Rhagoletis zephyria]